MSLPVNAKVGVIDKSDVPEIGLSAMQLDNIGQTGKYNGVIVGFIEKKERARCYNAFGMHAMDGEEIRISMELASRLGCHIGEQIQIECLAVIDE